MNERIEIRRSIWKDRSIWNNLKEIEEEVKSLENVFTSDKTEVDKAIKETFELDLKILKARRLELLFV